MTMVLIRLGDGEYRGNKKDDGYDLLRFLNGLMYPHKKDFMQIMSEYIDFSDNYRLWKEVADMGGLGQSILDEGISKGIEQGTKYQLIHMVRKKMNKGKTPKLIAEELDEEPELVNQICRAIKETGFEGGCEKIYILLNGKERDQFWEDVRDRFKFCVNPKN